MARQESACKKATEPLKVQQKRRVGQDNQLHEMKISLHQRDNFI